MKRTIMHGLSAALCLALAFPLAAQSAAEEKIELPDVTTVVTGDTLTAGKEEKQEIARNMIRLGKLALEDISLYSGLSIKEVKELAEKPGNPAPA